MFEASRLGIVVFVDERNILGWEVDEFTVIDGFRVQDVSHDEMSVRFKLNGQRRVVRHGRFVRVTVVEDGDTGDSG